MLVDLLVSLAKSAAKCCYRDIVLLRAVAYALHYFAKTALPVSSSLAGDDQVRVLDQTVEIDQVKNCLDAGFHLRVQEDLQCCAESACRTCTGCIVRIDAEFSDDHIAVVAHALFQPVQDLRGAAFLFAEGVGRTVLAAERIGDVAHDGEMCLLDILVEAAYVDVGYLLKVAAFSFQGIAVLIEEADAQRARKSHAAVVCCGAADRDRDICKARVYNGLHQFTGSVSCRVERVPQFFGNHGKPGGLCHLQNCFFLTESAVVSADFFHERSVNRHIHFPALSGQDHCVCSSLAAVRDRYADRLAGTEHFVRRFGEKFYCLLAGNCSLKRI